MPLARRGQAGVAVALAIALLSPGRLSAQPRDQAPPPPGVAADSMVAPPEAPLAPPPPPAQPPPPPIVENRPLPPLVQNVPPPPPVVIPQAPGPAPAPPTDVEQEERRSGKLFLSSLGTFVLSYGLTILAGAIRAALDDPAASDLYIPLAGPLVFWEGTNMKVDGEAGAYLILSTVAQTVGFFGMIFGLIDLTSDGTSANY